MLVNLPAILQAMEAILQSEREDMREGDAVITVITETNAAEVNWLK